LSTRESGATLAAVAFQSAPPNDRLVAQAMRLRIVLRNIIANDGRPPYDILLAIDGMADATRIRIGSLDLFGGTGHTHQSPRPESLSFEASEPIAQLARMPGFALARLRVLIVRRGFPGIGGEEFVPGDPDPPRIGAIELLQS